MTEPMTTMKGARISGAALVSLACLVTAAAAVGVACAGTPNAGEETNMYVSPNAYSDFAGGAGNSGVQGMLAAKCGSLDCHGAVGEALRIFSQNGLRLGEDGGTDVPGGAATTPAEIFATYVSAITIQPEDTSKVFHGDLDPHALLLLRKPLGLERHKGGQVLQSGDPGDVCLTTWLQDGLVGQNGASLTINNVACNAEAALP
jgi:hypothetical protein